MFLEISCEDVKMVQIVTKENLGSSFVLDTNAKKIDIKVDDNTIGKSQDGALQLKTTSTAFIEAVHSASVKTYLTSRVDTVTGHRYLEYVNEDGEQQTINLSEFLSDVTVSGGTLNGQMLTFESGNGDPVTIDLSVFATEDELQDALSAAFNEVAVDAFGTQLFKVKSL